MSRTQAQESSSHPSPCLDLLKDLHLEGVGRGFESLRMCFGQGESASHLKGGEEVYIGPPKKLVIVVLFMCLSELPTWGRNFRPVDFLLAERVLLETA